MTQPVLIIHGRDGKGPIRIEGRWSDGAAVFDGFNDYLSFDRLEVIIDGQAKLVYTPASMFWPEDTLTVPASISH